MKRISIPYLFATLLVLCALIFLISPAEPIKTIELLEIDRVIAYDENSIETDLTEQLDLDAVKAILLDCRSNRLPYDARGYLRESVVSIDARYNQEPLHILLGTANEIYESAEKGVYGIRNSEELLERINALIENGK